VVASPFFDTGKSRLHFLHRANEAEALARQGLYEALLLSAVADGTSRDIQPGRQRGIGYDTSIPDRIDQLILADNAIPVMNEVREQVKCLGGDGQDVRPATKLAPVNVQCVVLEEITQTQSPLCRPECSIGAQPKK